MAPGADGGHHHARRRRGSAPPRPWWARRRSSPAARPSPTTNATRSSRSGWSARKFTPKGASVRSLTPRTASPQLVGRHGDGGEDPEAAGRAGRGGQVGARHPAHARSARPAAGSPPARRTGSAARGAPDLTPRQITGAAVPRRRTDDRALRCRRGRSFEETYGSSVNARMASHVGEGPSEPVDDVARPPSRATRRCEGAQWDEVHRRWEVWDEAAEAWAVVGDDAGDGVAPARREPAPAAPRPRAAPRRRGRGRARGGRRRRPRVARSGPAPRGAQWNEVDRSVGALGRGHRAWVEATVDPETDAD